MNTDQELKTIMVPQEESSLDEVFDLIARLGAAQRAAPSPEKLRGALKQLRRSDRGREALALFHRQRAIGLDFENWLALSTLCQAIGADLPPDEEEAT
jgi:hypothetical protein